jgi:hypothetical protein
MVHLDGLKELRKALMGRALDRSGSSALGFGLSP